MVKIFRKAIILLLSSIILGALLLTIVFLLPVSEQSGNAAASMQLLEKEGWYPGLPYVNAYDGSYGSQVNSGGVLDNFTDGIMISQASAARERNVLRQALEVQGYTYYWHGYIIILRPLLLLFDYAQIRVLNGLIQILLIVVMSCILYKKKGMRWSMLALTAYGLLMPMALSFSLQYSWVFYIGILGSIAVIRYRDYLSKNNRIYLLFMVLGLLTSYFDLLTYPLFTWGMPMIWWHVMGKDENTEKSRLWETVCGGLFWILGYAGMWGGKWVLGQFVLNINVIAEAWSEVRLRSGMMDNIDTGSISRWYPIVYNWKKYCNVQTVSILAGWFGWLGIRLARKKGRIECRKSPALLLIALSPFVWYLVLHNHTYIHAAFTYRIFVLSFTAVLAVLLIGVENRTEGIYYKWAGKLIPAAILLLAVTVMFADREDYWTHNGGAQSVQIELQPSDMVEQVIVPEYGRIQYMQLGLKADGELNGSFTIELYREEELCFEASLPAADVGDSGFYKVPMDINVKKGEAYRLCISMEDCDNTNTYVSLTNEGEFPLKEFKGCSVNYNENGSQLIGGIGYSRLPGLMKLLLDFLTQIGVYWAVYTAIAYALYMLHEKYGRRVSGVRKEKE